MQNNQYLLKHEPPIMPSRSAGIFVLGILIIASLLFGLDKQYPTSNWYNSFTINFPWETRVTDNRTGSNSLEEQAQIVNVVNQTSPAVVSVVASGLVPNSAGTGFIVTPNGYIMTNRHVVEDSSTEYTVIIYSENSAAKEVPARVVASDDEEDVAVLKIDMTDLPTINLGDSDYVEVGQTAITIGYSLGQFENTVSTGLISGLKRSIVASGEDGRSPEQLKNLIQTNAAIHPGNSGGPLLDLSGNAIGMNVAMIPGENISFAIPINTVKNTFNTVAQQ